jgi:hypothetical protein
MPTGTRSLDWHVMRPVVFVGEKGDRTCRGHARSGTNAIGSKPYAALFLAVGWDGLVHPELDPEAAALHLLSCFVDRSVIGRLTQSKAKLRSLTRTALQILREPSEAGFSR